MVQDSYVQNFLSRDRLGSLLGGVFISLSENECIYEYSVNPEHYNPNGILHGGALYSIMDSSQGMLVHSTLDKTFSFVATGTSTIKYLAPLKTGKVRIRTVIQERTGRKIFVNSTASDEGGRSVATLDEIWIAK